MPHEGLSPETWHRLHLSKEAITDISTIWGYNTLFGWLWLVVSADLV